MDLLAFSDLHRDREQAAKLVRRSNDAELVVGAGDVASFRLRILNLGPRGLLETV